jgi:rhamnose utilization protein RhaD (predicted bifunctional aldolase and dehydrogenase)
MHKQWNDAAAAACASELALRAYTSRLIGSDPALVLHGGGNTSVKLTGENGGGYDQAVLYVKGSGADLAQVAEENFTPLALAPLHALLEQETLPAHDIAAAVAPYILRAGAPKPSIETLMHAALPWRYVEHTHSTAVLALCNTPDGEAHVRAAFGGQVVIVPYRHSGFDLARACAWSYTEQYRPGMAGMVLMHHGACAWGEDAKSSYDAMLGLAARAEAYLRERGAWELIEDGGPEIVNVERARVIARLRLEAAREAGRPLIATLRDDAFLRGFARRADLPYITVHGPATPGHTIFTKRYPQLGRDVAGFAARYRGELEETLRHLQAEETGEALAQATRKARGIDGAPRVILDAELGLLALGVNKHFADAAASVYASDAKVIARAEKLQHYATIGQDMMLKAEIEYAGFEARVAQREPQAGRVALVGDAVRERARIEELLAQGWSVAAIDTNPIVSSFSSAPGFLGLRADIEDATDRARVFDTVVRAFGGIDSIAASSPWDRLFQPLLEFAIP